MFESIDIFLFFLKHLEFHSKFETNEGPRKTKKTIKISRSMLVFLKGCLISQVLFIRFNLHSSANSTMSLIKFGQLLSVERRFK